jgi:hypothetical protein
MNENNIVETNIYKRPKKHILKGLIKKNRVPIYQLKYFIGQGCPSESELWKMLSGYKEFPEELEKTIYEIFKKS